MKEVCIDWQFDILDAESHSTGVYRQMIGAGPTRTQLIYAVKFTFDLL